jgi:CRP-like cAMP-binding protein
VPRIEQPTVRNHLLASLSPDDFARLAGALQPVTLALKQVLHEPGQMIESVYFVEAGTASMIAPLKNGDALEVGLIGRDGLVGLPVVLRTDLAVTEALIQVPGAALRLPAAVLREALAASPSFLGLLLRYMQAFHVQVTQSAACNGRHPLEERLARWLLMTHDRAEGDVLPLTQEFLAIMLGVRRAGVSVAAGILHKAGVIGYTQGRITVLDRPGLEAVACECYGTVRREYARTLGWPAERVK